MEIDSKFSDSLLNDINDAFSSSSKTVSEMALQKKVRQNVVETPKEPDPKQQKREELKRKALALSKKSETSSRVSDMSYQSSLSETVAPFITMTKQPKRPKSPVKFSSKLEQVSEERKLRCASP
jgi:hypothetical protein